MKRWRHVAATAIFCASIAAAGSYFPGPPAWLTGILFDTTVSATASIRDGRTGADQPQVAVIAVDAASLDAPELQPYPRALFGPVWALTIPALQDAGARAIAFDAVFSYSANRFRDDYDKSFLKALRNAKDKLVIGYSSRLAPTRTHLAALAFDQGALGSLDLFADEDEILRSHIGQRKTSDGDTFLGLAGAALARANIATIPEEIVLAPTRHPEAIPTYSLIDVLRCAGSAPEALKAAINGKIVFVGTTLPEEDRVISSSRFMPAPREPAKKTHECGLRRLEASAPDTKDVPGVHLFAVATQMVLSGHDVIRADTGTIAAISSIAALAGAAIGFILAPILAVIATAVTGTALWTAQAYLLLQDIWLDVGNALIALVAAAVIAYLVRYAVEERSRKRIQTAFGRYLAPTLVNQLADSESTLQLGGEERDVTIMFADLSGFTALSGKLDPEALVDTTNAYLKLIADAVDASGGYVDKFIGDAVMAIWGAPVAAREHPLHAVETALKIASDIAQKRETAIARGEHAFDVKIGINSGPVVVGNVGSEKRYNYTAVGEAVNIAARLEGLPGVYKCRVIIGPETAERVSGKFHLREIDMVTVKGKAEPLRIYEPVATEKNTAHVTFAEALRLYRNRKFAEAASKWAEIAEMDGPAAVMAQRAQAFALNPPDPDWDGVYAMTEK